jgi:phosphatidylglycerol---prolipoprotein diacylglyceryl transferase
LTFPVFIDVGSIRVPAHAVLEVLAYTVGFEIYRRMRIHRGDPVGDATRWTVIAAAAVGAAMGSKILFWLEDPRLTLEWIRTNPAMLMGGKTIVGGFLGGTIAVEIAKRAVGERRSTGDLFVIPLCIGTALGRIGCFLGGLEDHTYGTASSLPWAVDFGDGIARHPTQLYELVFVLALAIVLFRLSRRPLPNGHLFKLFLLGYLGFRLAVDSLKPAVSFFGLSTIQWTCIVAIAYYARFVPQIVAGIAGSEDPAYTVAVSKQT